MSFRVLLHLLFKFGGSSQGKLDYLFEALVILCERLEKLDIEAVIDNAI